MQRLHRLNDFKTANRAKPNANHKLLGELADTWNYVLKIWVGPNKLAVETDGIVVRKPTMDRRYYFADFTVEMLPGADGKPQKANFEGKLIEGYDNVKQKFVSIWIDNVSTGPTTLEGTYDPASRTFTYNSETESQPGKKTKVREVIKVTDRIITALTGMKNMTAARSKRSRSTTRVRTRSNW